MLKRNGPADKGEAGVRFPSEPGLDTSTVAHRQYSNAPTSALAPVDIFAPWAGVEERALRVRMHRARDAAQARATRSRHGRARTLYWIAAQLASDWVFQRAQSEDLNDILATLSYLFLACGKIERVEAHDE
jgi:muconolactone delta-isomerase